MAADFTNITKAIMALLAADATLSSLMPDGVFKDVAPNSSTRFVIVSVTLPQWEPMEAGRAFLRVLYLVEAVERTTSAVNVNAAAARIDALLEDQPLTITGFTHMQTRCLEPVDATEVDEENPDTRWQHRGGRYEVHASPN
jgi:hypothetical protein